MPSPFNLRYGFVEDALTNSRKEGQYTRPSETVMCGDSSGLINQYRQANGVGTLLMSDVISDACDKHNRDMGKYGVTCNALRPNAATRMTVTDELMAAWKKRFVDSGGTDEAEFKKMIDKLVLSSTPEHIAPVVVWLATEEAANVNGATFFISGNEIGIYAEPAVTQKITKEKGFWSVDELVNITPKELTNNWANPMPAQPAK